MSSSLRVLVVDDEPLARDRLTTMLGAEPGIEVVGTCAEGLQAVERLRAGGIDLVLLDVQMPGRTGIEVAREIGPANMPEVVFVTAYDAHAIEAFEVHALDYLLKPYDRPRLRRALDRARRERRRRESGELS